VENPADVLTKPRDVMLLADLVDCVSMSSSSRAMVESVLGERKDDGGCNANDERERESNGITGVETVNTSPSYEVQEEEEEDELFLGDDTREMVDASERHSMPSLVDSDDHGANRASERSDGANRAGMGEQEVVDRRRVANRTARTPYGLRSDELLKPPDRLVYLIPLIPSIVESVFESVLKVLLAKSPGFDPDVPIVGKGTMCKETVS
jgi:hypothetical protein